MDDAITVEALVRGPVEKVWNDYIDPMAIMAWSHASDDWHTTKVTNDVRQGGTFLSRMEAKDGSAGFDFSGVYDEVVSHQLLKYTMDDGRQAQIAFKTEGDLVRVTVTFEPEKENTHELQQAGWQAILDNFKTYSERA